MHDQRRLAAPRSKMKKWHVWGWTVGLVCFHAVFLLFFIELLRQTSSAYIRSFSDFSGTPPVFLTDLLHLGTFIEAHPVISYSIAGILLAMDGIVYVFMISHNDHITARIWSWLFFIFFLLAAFVAGTTLLKAKKVLKKNQYHEDVSVVRNTESHK